MSEVELLLRDVTKGVARPFSPLVGQNLEGVWHSSVLVFGVEVFFSGGVACAPPKAVLAAHGPVNRREMLGVTRRSPIELSTFLTQQAREFTVESYDLTDRNCNHFTDTLLKWLLPESGGLDPAIVNQAAALSHTVVGKLVFGAMNAWENAVNMWYTWGADVAEAQQFQWSPSPSPFEQHLQLLWESQETTHERKLALLQRLDRIGANILHNPADPKFRQLNANSEALRLEILGLPYGRELLEDMGFNPDIGGSSATYRLMGIENVPSGGEEEHERLQTLRTACQLCRDLLRADSLMRAELPQMVPTFQQKPGVQNQHRHRSRPPQHEKSSCSPRSGSQPRGSNAQAERHDASATRHGQHRSQTRSPTTGTRLSSASRSPQVGAADVGPTFVLAKECAHEINDPELEALAQQLNEMGFHDGQIVREILHGTGKDLNAALDKLALKEYGEFL